MVKGCGLKAPEIRLVEDEPDRPVSGSCLLRMVVLCVTVCVDVVL